MYSYLVHITVGIGIALGKHKEILPNLIFYRKSFLRWKYEPQFGQLFIWNSEKYKCFMSYVNSLGTFLNSNKFKFTFYFLNPAFAHVAINLYSMKDLKMYQWARFITITITLTLTLDFLTIPNNQSCLRISPCSKSMSFNSSNIIDLCLIAAR